MLSPRFMSFLRFYVTPAFYVIPAKAGTHSALVSMGPRLRGDDTIEGGNDTIEGGDETIEGENDTIENGDDTIGQR